MSVKSLIINPGSTSTKIGVFEDETLLFEETLRHSTEEIAQYASIVDQKDFRKDDRSLCSCQNIAVFHFRRVYQTLVYQIACMDIRFFSCQTWLS